MCVLRLEKQRGRNMQLQMEAKVCKQYMLDKPKKEGKLDKQILGYLMTQRSYKHISLVNNAFNYLSLTTTLVESISKFLGKSQAASLMQTVIGIAVDEKDFICRQWVSLLKKSKLAELGYLFIHRSEIDFDLIRSTFEYKNYANGISLKGWIHKNLHLNHTSLTQILKSICDAFQIESVEGDELEQKQREAEEAAAAAAAAAKAQAEAKAAEEAAAAAAAQEPELERPKSIVDDLMDGPQNGGNSPSSENKDAEDTAPDKDYAAQDEEEKNATNPGDDNTAPTEDTGAGAGPGAADEEEEDVEILMNEQIKALKELFDGDMNLFLRFHKFIQQYSGSEETAIAKKKKLNVMFASAMAKMVAKKKSSQLDRKLAVTVCIVILLHELSKFDAMAKEYAGKAKTKEVRAAWVAKFVQFNADNDGSDAAKPQDEKELNFQSFFTSFWNYIPDWPEPPADA